MAKETYICKCCGKEFIPRNKNSKYCSKECAYKSMIKPRTTKICLQCGKEYDVVPSDPRNFCNRKCFEKYRSRCEKISIKVCPICNRTFETYHHDSIYCSKECTSLSQRKRRIVKCEQCGKEFERWESEYIKNKRHFCSRECRDKALKWCLEDIEILRNNYKKISLKEIQPLLSKKHSVEAIKSKCTTLGLGESRLWSDDEINVIKDCYEIKPLNEIMEMLPKRTVPSILSQARKLGLLGYFYRNKVYSQDDIKFLQENYINMTNDELSKILKRDVKSISQKLWSLNLYRPKEIKKSGYADLVSFMRSRLSVWSQEVKALNNYTCCLTGSKTNIVVHHCYGFNLLFDEIIELLNFPLYENFQDYTDDQLNTFVDEFMDLQEYYHSYVCITEDIHKEFHKIYGYGDNTEDQWNKFVENYKLQNIA